MPNKSSSRRYSDDRTTGTVGSTSSITGSCSDIDTTSNSEHNSQPTTVQEILSYVTSCGTRDTTFFNCGGGRGSYINNSMQRASVSRRLDNISSPGIRSRSSEPPMVGTTNENLNDGGTATDEIGSGIKGESGHYRSMSDPFDTAQVDIVSPAGTGDEDDDDDDDFYEAATNSLSITEIDANDGKVSNLVVPTFTRYPCAETRNKNCWSEPPISIFSVRGSTYCSDQKKVPSADYLLCARGSDLFLTDCKKPFDLNTITHSILGGHLLKQSTLAINFRFPWGYMNLYFAIPDNLVVYMNDDTSRKGNMPTIDPSLSVAEKTLAKWLLGDTTYKNERLKLIPYVAEGPWVVRNMVTGRPAIIGKKLPVSYQLTPAKKSSSDHKALLTATLDIGNSSATAKRIVSVCRRYMSALTVDIGFVIQGDSAAELPEQMLGAMRVHGPDPLKASKLN